MKARLYLSTIVLFLQFPLLVSALPSKTLLEAENPHLVRVRLTDATPVVSIRGFDLQIFDRHKNVVKKMDRGSEWKILCQAGRVRMVPIKSEGPAQEVELQEPVSLLSQAGFMYYKGAPYREKIVIHTKGSFCEVVNHLDLEKYLEGLVNAEFNSKWSEESVAAQVIAARTYAYFQILEARKEGTHFDLDATIKDQVYDGSYREDYRSARVVRKTDGLILAQATGRAPTGIPPLPIKAFYHSTCGGQTILPEKVWGTHFAGFTKGAYCPFCAVAPKYKWSMGLSSIDIWQAISHGVKIDGPLKAWPKNWEQVLKTGRLEMVRVASFDGDGRAGQIETFWKVGFNSVVLSMSSVKFREWLGGTKVLSTWFSISYKSGQWRVDGRGNGHGVGMCQWGAKVMGEKGFKTAAILKHYYPGADLRRAW